MLNGQYLDLSNNDYHATDAISRSRLMIFKNNPRKYASTLLPDAPKREMTSALAIGNAFHTISLEFHKFNEEFIVVPNQPLLKDVGREEYDRIKDIIEMSKHSNKIILKPQDRDLIMAMRLSLFSNKDAFSLTRATLSHKLGLIESSYFWTDEHSGLQLKCRPDLLDNTNNYYIDLKTISDASAVNYQREMVKYGYHIQGAMVRDGVKAVTGREITSVINICVEKEWPHAIGIYIIDEAALEAGHREYKQLCLDLANATKNDDFSDYPIQEIGLPTWYV